MGQISPLFVTQTISKAADIGLTFFTQSEKNPKRLKKIESRKKTKKIIEKP